MICGKCGKLHASGKTCLYCGAVLSEHARSKSNAADGDKEKVSVCINCGANVDSGKRVCTECGIPMGMTATQYKLSKQINNIPEKAATVLVILSVVLLILYKIIFGAQAFPSDFRMTVVEYFGERTIYSIEYSGHISLIYVLMRQIYFMSIICATAVAAIGCSIVGLCLACTGKSNKVISIITLVAGVVLLVFFIVEINMAAKIIKVNLGLYDAYWYMIEGEL